MPIQAATQSYPASRSNTCSVISGGQLKRTGTTDEPAMRVAAQQQIELGVGNGLKHPARPSSSELRHLELAKTR
jgi:hypothetical protein